MQKKNIFTDLADLPGLYLIIIIFYYFLETPLLFTNMDGERVAHEGGFWLFKGLIILYTLSFLFGSYVNWKYNHKHHGMIGFFAFSLALLEIITLL